MKGKKKDLVCKKKKKKKILDIFLVVKENDFINKNKICCL